MARRNGKDWYPQHIRGANAQWDPLAGLGAFSRAWQLENRVLFLTTAINAQDSVTDDEWTPGVSGLIAALRMLDALSTKPIKLYINSPGGDIHAGMALIQTMRDLASPVHTFVIQQAASMAAVVAVAGARRSAFPTSRWLLHRGKEWVGEDLDHEDLGIRARELKIIDKTADRVLLNFTKIKADQLDDMQRKDFWLGAREALRWGIIDSVAVPRQGPAEIKAWLPKRSAE